MLKNYFYQISTHKLMKIKKYLKKNLKKRFINLNFAFYVSSIFFTAKLNKNFRFCINYRKFNAIN